MLVSVERVKFKRPNSDKIEIGLLVGEFGRHCIIDNGMNIVINCSLESYYNDRTEYNLNPSFID